MIIFKSDRAPAHQNKRDEGEKSKYDPDYKELDKPFRPFFPPLQSGNTLFPKSQRISGLFPSPI